MKGGAAVDVALTVARKAHQLADDRSQLRDESDRLSREVERVERWGSIDVERITRLKERGVIVMLYELPTEEASSFLDELPHAIVITRTKRLTRMIGVSLTGDPLPERHGVVLPFASTEALRRRITQLTRRIGELSDDIEAMSIQRSVLLEAQRELAVATEFSDVAATMETKKELSWITGFVPTDRCSVIRKAAADNGWGVVIEDPSEEEQVPTEVRNPKPIGIIQPVFKLIGTVPGYRELDISFFFLIFFVVFFAMIIGDGGYGLLFLIGTIAAAVKGQHEGKSVGQGTVLMIVLSTATVVWGAITGNWFGYAPLAELPVLRSLVIPEIASSNPLSSRTVQYMTFIIGTVHLSIAHVWNFLRALRKKPLLAAFEQLGWLSMVLGLYYLVLQMVLDPALFPMPHYALYMIIGGFGAVVIFGEQAVGQNFFVGIGKGFANLITTSLSGVSAFSDIISYIRLFAVGLASLAIAQAFNGMGGGLFESLGGVGGVILATIVILFGHILNIAMAALSVIVHGVRLNMLEFSQHLNMEWTGVEYAPFRTRS